MEPELLHFILVFLLGTFVGIGIMLLVNKVRSGSAAPKNVQQEFDSYQAEVERHFEETSKKFKDMTEQYQALYQHLSIGATSLCRPDSVAAALADERSPMDKLVNLADGDQTSKGDKPAGPVAADVKPAAATKPKESDKKGSETDAKPSMADQNLNGKPSAASNGAVKQKAEKHQEGAKKG